ncbi:hypothetical protein [Phenylobacterium sp.]|jgi:hypothetical protein|uniref:hypothetical protein n=1 Tax=Phenylobacterium sp. TaxID=1871053 RepID=UPI002F92428D
MRGRSRRGAGAGEAADDGPFASFTDLFIGILFLFLILVAALMLMHQEAIRREQVETQLMSRRIRDLQARLDAVPKPPPPPEPQAPAFRLGIVFNIYQRPAGSDVEWTYSRTVRIFRSPDGHCINTVLVRSNLSTAWRPPTSEEDIPTPEQQDLIRKVDACGISASGDHWETPSETGVMKRVRPDLYSGIAVLHKKEGDVRLEMEYRVLGVFDPHFR